MNACYFIDNEATRHGPYQPLTFSNFMARFFNYLLCADDPAYRRQALIKNLKT